MYNAIAAEIVKPLETIEENLNQWFRSTARLAPVGIARKVGATDIVLYLVEKIRYDKRYGLLVSTFDIAYKNYFDYGKLLHIDDIKDYMKISELNGDIITLDYYDSDDSHWGDSVMVKSDEACPDMFDSDLEDSDMNDTDMFDSDLEDSALDDPDKDDSHSDDSDMDDPDMGDSHSDDCDNDGGKGL
jgi:hypothetical protein